MAAPVWHTADQKVSAENATSIDAPDNLADGDLIILALHCIQRDVGNNDIFTPPAGFTRAVLAARDGTNSFNPVLDIYWKIADSEPGSYSFSCSKTSFRGLICRVTGHDSVNPIGIDSTVFSTSDVASITIPSMDVDFDESLVFAMTAHRFSMSSPNPPAGFTQVSFPASGNARHIAAVDEKGSGASGSMQFSWTTSRLTCAAALAINPPHAPPELSVESIDPVSGPPAGGTDVTITGTEFEAGATVHFGEHEATDVVVVNSTTITCKTPAADGS